MPEKTEAGAAKGEEGRQYIRTQDSFPLRFVPITKEEFASLLKVYTTARTQDRDEDLGALGGAPLKGVEGLDPVLLQMFERIERKLDQILEMQLVKGEDHRKSAGWENATCIDISGGGVRFTARWPAALGWYLKVVLPLPRLHPVTVVSAGLVVRSVKMTDAQGGAFWDIACQFEAIHEDDREEVIRYTFKRQQQLMRSRAAAAG